MPDDPVRRLQLLDGAELAATAGLAVAAALLESVRFVRRGAELALSADPAQAALGRALEQRAVLAVARAVLAGETNAAPKFRQNWLAYVAQAEAVPGAGAETERMR